MCGRFALVTPPTALRQFVEFVNLPNIEPRYNITPGQPVSLIRGEHEARLDPVQWGLVPGWAAPITCRAPARDHKSMRALKPCRPNRVSKMLFAAAARCCRQTGFTNGNENPVNPISSAKRTRSHFLWRRFGMSGRPDGSEVEGCAVVTVEASENLAHIHHRMPAMIAPADAPDWLSPPKPVRRPCKACYSRPMRGLLPARRFQSA